MKKEKQVKLCLSVIILISFVVWTVLVCYVDVEEIGPLQTSVGFSTLNRTIHHLTGVHVSLYDLTDWLGLIPIIIAVSFAFLGLSQLVNRKSIFKVDRDIILLGTFYVAVASVFIIFEIFPVNYRPVLIDGHLEASYPSSTTMIVMSVMPTAVMQINVRMKNVKLKRIFSALITIFTVFMVVMRLISGVHWFTDICGGILFSIGLVKMYAVLAFSGK